MYVSADDVGDVSASGYFSNGKDLGMQVSDVVLVVDTVNGLSTMRPVIDVGIDGSVSLSQDQFLGWDDSKFPFIGQGVDTTTGRLQFDYTDLGVSFAANARYTDELVAMIDQTSHKWKEETVIHPHIHWLQSDPNIPNFMLEYRHYNNGETPGAFSQAVLETEEVFTYPGSGTILQISSFPSIVMTDRRISCFVDYKFYRDSANASGLFAGADPLAAAVTVKEFDVHYLANTIGSEGEFTKYG